MKYFKIMLLVLLAFLLIIQFFPAIKNDKTNQSAIAITQVMEVPDNVEMILKTACYDCHSNHTKYPWYANIQPMGWVLANHIKDGKNELNFSEFGNYSARQQKSKLFGIKNSLVDETMPLTSYQIIHKNARLSKQQKQLLINWAENSNHTRKSKK